MVSAPKYTQTRSGKIFDVFNIVFFALLGLIMLFPILFVLVGSFSSSGLVQFRFGSFTLEAYKMMFESSRTMTSILNSVIITVVGTVLSVVVTATSAYALSKPSLPGRRIMIVCILFFILFNVGLIPEYIFYANTLKLKNTYWAMWMPGLISSTNLIIMINFFRALPAQVEESARIDGCNEAQSFLRIALPMSKASVATISLFYAVGYWNNYLNAIIYIDDTNLWPVTVWLRQFIVLSQASILEEVSGVTRAWLPSNAVKYATIIVSMLPIICIYPFAQKHFTKGVLVGAIKG